MKTTYRTLLVRKYFATIKEWSELSKKTLDECINTLKTKLGYQSVKQLTDLALCEVLAIIQNRIQLYV